MISNTPPPEAIAAIEAGVTRVVRRCEIYEADGETLWVPPNGDTRSRLVDGSVSLDYGRDERRTVDLTLANHDDMLETENGEGFWYNKILKPYRGVMYPTDPSGPKNSIEDYQPFKVWETQMGEFMIDRISEVAKNSQVKVVGRDYTKKLIGSKLQQSMSFPAGTYLYQLVKALASNAGIRKLKIPYTNETIGTRLDLERGTSRWEVIKKACNANNYDAYFDNQGYFTMSKFPDPTFDPPIMTFKAGKNLVDWERSTNDSELYNHIIVHGDRESVEGGEILMPYFGEAINNNPNSPTNVDQIGDRAYTFASSFFTSNAQCQAYAESLLKIHSLESYEISFSGSYYSHLDVGRVVEVQNPKKRTDSLNRFLLDSLDYSLTLGPLSGSGKRVLAVA